VIIDSCVSSIHFSNNIVRLLLISYCIYIYIYSDLICEQQCKNAPRIRDTNHLFLELPLLKDKLVNYIETTSVAGGWSQNAIQTTNAWLKEGLKSRCITRDLKWGVPVPLEEFKDKVRNLI
jgi:methionyl-tRNA synthetase